MRFDWATDNYPEIANSFFKTIPKSAIDFENMQVLKYDDNNEFMDRYNKLKQFWNKFTPQANSCYQKKKITHL